MECEKDIKVGDKLRINRATADEFNDRRWNIFEHGRKIYPREVFYKGYELGNILTVTRVDGSEVVVEPTPYCGTFITRELAESMKADCEILPDEQ